MPYIFLKFSLKFMELHIYSEKSNLSAALWSGESNLAAAYCSGESNLAAMMGQ
jgi:hypothetical protein